MKQTVKSNRTYVTADMRVGNKTVKLTTTDGDVYEFSLDELTSNDVKVPPAGKILKGIKATLSADGNTLFGYGPASGSHLVRFSEFAHGQNQPPSPRMQQGGERTLKDGRKWFAPDKLVCTALLEVVSGDFEGCFIALSMDYCFDKDNTGMATMNGSVKALKRWEDLVRLSGGDLSNATIPFSSNVLPELQDEFGNEVFQVRMENGFVADVIDIPAGLGVPKAKPAAKKPAPKAPAKSSVKGKTEKELIDEIEGKSAKKPAAPAKKAPVSAPIDTSKAKPISAPKARAKKEETVAPAKPTVSRGKAKPAADDDVDFPA